MKAVWWILIVPAAIIATVWLLAILPGFVPPPNAKVLIKIHHGQPCITRGQLQSQRREFVADILQQGNVRRGFIAVAYSRCAAFSRNIPRDIQQRLRNVLLNE
jgi:hypothetical protein